jgi:hypothetical protein
MDRGGRHPIVGLLRQSDFSRLARCQGVNDPDRLWLAPMTPPAGYHESAEKLRPQAVRNWGRSLSSRPIAIGHRSVRRADRLGERARMIMIEITLYAIDLMNKG